MDQPFYVKLRNFIREQGCGDEEAINGFVTLVAFTATAKKTISLYDKVIDTLLDHRAALVRQLKKEE